MSNAFLLEVVGKLPQCILPSVVGSQGLQAMSCLVFHQSVPVDECAKCFILCLERVCPDFPGRIVDEGDEILRSSDRFLRHWATDVRMH
jgi:hypothetical protein